VIDLEREDLAVCWCGAAGSRYGGMAIDGLREAKRIAAALNTALREKVRRKKERERRMSFPERWRPKKPTRIFGVFNTRTGRLHTFASAEAARKHLERHGGLRMQLRRYGCVNAGRRGWLTQWFRGPPQWPKEVRWFRGAR
jgi:hypothetical protein